MSTTFQNDIKPLFREEDRSAMEFAFDLWEYDEVRENSAAILQEVSGGGMPCDGAWPAEKVELFRTWVDEGMAE